MSNLITHEAYKAFVAAAAAIPLACAAVGRAGQAPGAFTGKPSISDTASRTMACYAPVACTRARAIACCTVRSAQLTMISDKHASALALITAAGSRAVTPMTAGAAASAVAEAVDGKPNTATSTICITPRGTPLTMAHTTEVIVIVKVAVTTAAKAAAT